MTIALQGSDALAAKASNAGVVTVAVWGRVAGTNYQNLVPAGAGAPVTIGGTITTYYTPGGSNQAIVSLVQMMNSSVSSVTVTQYAQAGGGQTQVGQWVIPALGRLEYTLEGWRIYDSSGNSQTVGTPGAIGPPGIAATAISLDPDQGEEGFAIPGVPGPQGNPGIQGIQGVAGIAASAISIEPDQGEEGFAIPGGPGPIGLTGSQGIQGIPGPTVFMDADQGDDGAPIPAGVGSNVPQYGGIFIPKNSAGRVFVDPANSQGWAGTDAGAWINSAFLYIHNTYTDTNGGIIELAPGSYTYATPIVLANAGLMSIILRGAGDGNGATILNYTPATATIAIAVGGGSGNDGGVQLENFTLTGSAQGNGATGIQFGVTGVANVAGATIKNVSIRRFTNGFAHLNGNSYGVTFINCKVQQTTNGYTPQGENNNWHGGLLGGNANGLIANTACEYQMFGVAFDDNTTTAINSSNSLARGTLDGCRFENAGGGTDTYVTISAGTISQQGGGMQNDIVAAGTSTGFVQASGGVYSCLGTWLESAAGSARAFTQIFNLSGTVIAHIDPVISPVGAITGTTQLCTAGYAAKRLDWLRLSNFSTAVQTIATLGAAPGTYLTNSNINVPATAIVGVAVGTTFEWTFKMSKSAVGTGNFSFIFYAGTNGTTGDTAVVTINLTQTAVIDDAMITATLVCATAGASGTLTGMVSGINKAASPAGFGFVIGTSGPAAVTSGAFNLTTSALKFGMALASATGTPAVTVSNVKARVYNLD